MSVPVARELTVDAALRAAADRLARAGVPAPRVDAEILLAHVVGSSRAEVVRAALLGTLLGEFAQRNGFADRNASSAGPAAVWDSYDAALSRRAGREPLQHITGRGPFRYLELEVGPGVFIPRPETEQVAQVAIDAARGVVEARGEAVVVDLCTGSGAIALAIATEVPGAQVYAVELDGEAFSWAARNVERVRERTGAEVRLVRGDARRALAGRRSAGGLDGICDVVVSNPPYIPGDATPHDREVADHDPAVALFGLGPDGLEVPRGIVGAAARLLRPGGVMVMEHAEVQDAAVRNMVATGGLFEDVRTAEDLTGRPRMVIAVRSRTSHQPEPSATTSVEH